ncbi:hypothetical protein AU252_15515 [Pseudarthrobacter sulfonivorans]|uniref:O-antigen ligase-related domain-containing protein n=2 Tax=Pseudarthrobacter sulfonivorans TaxID=121292 RepID=A0A0U3QDA8_9MICC|nr:hypothetical protein AU252_15515 [Pseudarthrobacter sulfonivorans]
MHMLLWAVAITAVACSVLESQGLHGVSRSISAIAGFAFPCVMLAGIFGTLAIRGRAAHPLVPAGLLAFSGVVASSAVINGQIGEVTWGVALGVLYLPGLVLAIWKTSASRESIRQTVRRISVSVVWLSLAYAAVDLTHALGDLPRRIVLPGVEFRLAGVTPHANLLAFTAAIAFFLTMRARPRFWLLHLLACLAILFLAEARTLTVGLLVAGAGYWIVNARKSRMVRAINTAIFGAPIAVFLWPAIVSSFDESSLASDVTTLNSRTLVWDLVAANWTERPVFGWGAFTFDNATGSPLSALFFNNSHNQFLEALIEGGTVGLLLMGGVAVALAWSLTKARDAPYVAVTIMCLFFMMTEVPFTLHNYGFSYVVVLAALLLAILVPGPTVRSAAGSVEPTLPERQDAHLAKLEGALTAQRIARTSAVSGPGEPR